VPEKRYLFTPGPTPVPPEVLAKLAEPVIHHRAADYRALFEEVLERLRAVPASVGSVMVIGHNPGLHDLALTLAARGAALERLREKFPTGGLAILRVDDTPWPALAPGTAELEAYVVPRELA
jgi:phosphohistidine phosphatase